MTLPPSKIGDKGQRYVLELKGYPCSGWQSVQYSNNKGRLEESIKHWSTAPGYKDYKIVDRHDSSSS